MMKEYHAIEVQKPCLIPSMIEGYFTGRPHESGVYRPVTNPASPIATQEFCKTGALPIGIGIPARRCQIPKTCHLPELRLVALNCTIKNKNMRSRFQPAPCLPRRPATPKLCEGGNVAKAPQSCPALERRSPTRLDRHRHASGTPTSRPRQKRCQSHPLPRVAWPMARPLVYRIARPRFGSYIVNPTYSPSQNLRQYSVLT